MQYEGFKKVAYSIVHPNLVLQSKGSQIQSIACPRYPDLQSTDKSIQTKRRLEIRLLLIAKFQHGYLQFFGRNLTQGVEINSKRSNFYSIAKKNNQVRSYIPLQMHI